MLKDRLKEARKKANKSQKDVVEAIGITQSALSQLETGRVDSSSHLPAIANFLGVDAYWLQTGEHPTSIKDQEFQRVSAWDEKTPLEDDEVEIPFFEDFSFACGSGSINEHIANEKRKLRIPKTTLRNLSISKDNAVAATATGDSMSPTIQDGDTIHIDIGRKEIKDGRIFVICIGGLHYAKRLYNLPFGGVRIVSDNSVEFPEIVLSAEEKLSQDFQVIGWIWQITRIEKW
ncbi:MULTISPECIES: helix-turn-helix transcriptional regulator [unclassified Acinetobacter]|uniref:XRE family transcriptional regulator n=1 Tax=unclassified Acinetobacter TaxID=196816 RepID=UPI001C21ADE1|nr:MULTISPECIES: helix-turn-helix transcriptional regulator [unclassified Acinetobacter]